jgi:hypothetical protein
MAAAVVISDGLNRDRRPHVAGPAPYWLSGKYTLATTSLDDTDDKVILDKFPARCKIMDAFVILGDLDGATGLVWDLSTATALDGTVGTVLIADSTVGRSAGSDSIDEAKRGTSADGDFLMFHTNTAATTPASSTIEWHVQVVEDNDVQTHSSSITAAQAAAPGEELT